ncbi:hypothetical protein L9G15_13760 [Shewanella sp. A3A]|nr:hypothetical protein [Shewanella ferrihydritica]
MKKHVLKLMGGNLLSKILGFVREIANAAFYGTGTEIGAYRIAQTATLIPINFLTSDTLNSAFIPLYKKFSKDENFLRCYVWTMLGVFSIFSLLLTAGTNFYSYEWVGLLVPNADSDFVLKTNELLIIMAYGIVFYMLSNLLIFISMANDNYLAMAFRPSVQNIGMLVGTFVSFYSGNYLYLAWGFTASYFLFFLFLLYTNVTGGYLRLPSSIKVVYIKHVLISFWTIVRPLLLLPIVSQGNIAVEKAMASYIGINAIASVDYARFTTESIFFLISTPVAFVGLSSWSGLPAEKMRETLRTTIKVIFMIAIPISSLVYINSELIVRLLFQRGQFDETSAYYTIEILKGMSIGIWAQAVGYILIKALNAQMENKKVFIAMSISMTVNAVFNLLFVKEFGAFSLGLGAAMYGVTLFFISYFMLNIQYKVLNELVKYLVAACLIFLFCSVSDNSLFNLVISIVLWILFIIYRKDRRELILFIFSKF